MNLSVVAARLGSALAPELQLQQLFRLGSAPEPLSNRSRTPFYEILFFMV
jgi:hypothetical protein